MEKKKHKGQAYPQQRRYPIPTFNNLLQYTFTGYYILRQPAKMKASGFLALCAFFATIQGLAIHPRASEEVATSEEVTTPALHNSYKRGEEGEEEVTTPALHNSYKRDEGEEEEVTSPALHNSY